MAEEALEKLMVDVARLDKEGESYKGELAPGALDLGGDPDGLVTPLGGMCYDLWIEALGTELLVRGKVWQRIRCVCSRCAEEFETVAEDGEFVRSVEISEDTDFVDLTGEVREAIILAFPGYPVCRETCKGLCPTCGKNLNDGPCGCRKQAEDCWAALDGLIK
jgi:uncharacterized protein